MDPEKVNEEAMEAIKEEEAGEDKNEAAVTETEKKTDENRAQTRELLYTALTRVKPVEDAKSKEIKGGV